MLNVGFDPPALPAAGALILLAPEGAAPAGLWAEAEAATNGAIGRALAAAEFAGRKSQICTVLAPGAGLSRVVAVGLGKSAELSERVVRDAAGSAIAAVARDTQAAIAADLLPSAQAAAAAEGAVLRAYRFDRYRTRTKPEDRPLLAGLRILAAEPEAARAAWGPRAALCRGVFLARDLVSEPPNVLTPAEMARRCETLRELGVEVEVFGPDQLRELGFGAMLGVARGSAQEPRMVAMRWRGAGGQGDAQGNGRGPIALVGKGVTFDSGGISIKPAAGMEDMKFDMAGAGAVVGAMAALAGRRAPADVVAVVGLVENMPSGDAMRPSDVVTTASGQTVEVINTDAEGRLVLADAVWWCQKQFKPRLMVDLATLTGAMVISLGHEHAGMFSSCDKLAAQLLAAGEASGETLWRMPLGEAYDKQLKSEIADMKNTGTRPGGAISAAHFIKRFTNDVPWAHLDIAGTAWTDKDRPVTPKGATAFGVRLLDRFVADHHEPRPD